MSQSDSHEASQSDSHEASQYDTDEQEAILSKAEEDEVSVATPVEIQPGGIIKFIWHVRNISSSSAMRIYSEIFGYDDYKWRILIFPKGNGDDHLAIYLDVASVNLPHGWSISTHFRLSIINYINDLRTIRKETKCIFNANERDWGFVTFMPLAELYNPCRGYIFRDACTIEVEVAVLRPVESYDSKKETGFVGLKNQGATCYMNSLLQMLYHIPYFRKAVYHMPTNAADPPSANIPLALQWLFYKLQYGDSIVATEDLTKSFGWDAYDAFLQHDVQELNRVLCENLEEKMKRTAVEGAIQQLFEGHQMNYIECVNVDYKSCRKESFYDLQLDVKGCPDVYASFDKYVEVEQLDDNNKYYTEQYGLQDAKKGVLFIDLPPVLQLHLKRFEYDTVHNVMVKVNDRFEFPLQLDLDRDNGKYMSPEADRKIRNLYTLHSVLVHRGGVHGGHYYVFIRPTLSSQWYKFDDELVTKEDTDKALEDLYGGEETVTQTNPGLNNISVKFPKFSNAYMLVYIRESDKDKILCNVDEKDIPEHLRERMKKEQEEKEQDKKERASAHAYTTVKVACDVDLGQQIGRDVFVDLVDHDNVKNIRVHKLTPFSTFKEEVAKKFDVPVQFQRFWLWARRQNYTYRLNRPLTIHEEAQPVGYLNRKGDNDEVNLFLEVERGLDLRSIPLCPYKAHEDILLFFKLYDPEKEELRYAGRLFVKSCGKPTDMLPELNKRAGYAPDEEIELYEEIKFYPTIMCERIDKRLTFGSNELGDGDIICFQKSLSAESYSCSLPREARCR